MSPTPGASGPEEPLADSTILTVTVDSRHRLVQLTERLDWVSLQEQVQAIRRKKLKSSAGRKPHLRALMGAVVLMATRKMGYREVEDLIQHYGPARYLCGLTQSRWTPDFTTIHDFTELLGEEGVRLLNEQVVQEAVDQKLADPSVLMADTTAQEAAISYPNEMGLMKAFLTAVVACSKHLKGIAPGLYQELETPWKQAKKKLRAHRLFAKTQEAKKKLTEEVANLVETVQSQVKQAMQGARVYTEDLVKYGKVAWSKLERLQQTMSLLLPQIRWWLETGQVSEGKIISVHVPELYSIVRGKAGKAVEFGLRWGIRRLGGGFVLAEVAKTRLELQDASYAVEAVDRHIELFGKAPKSYGYDRAGYSAANVKKLKNKGVKEVGIAPRGKAKWPVRGRVKERLVKERSQVEGNIGALKSGRYGFHRPHARSIEMMGAYGQRAVLGLNLNKLVRELAKRDGVVLLG